VATHFPASGVGARQVAASAAPAPVALPALALGQSLRLDETPAAHARAAAPLPTVAPPRATIEPLTADLRRLHVTVSKRFMEKLEAARDALSHSHPGADAEAILEAGLDLLIERHVKRRGTVAKPRTKNVPSPALSSRHIPAHVKREVWLRDGGRCQFRLENGELCGSTHRVQFDHVRPFALSGASSVANTSHACAAHNLLAARRVFGDALMDRYAPRHAAPPFPPG
jgi:hypothetical protein